MADNTARIILAAEDRTRAAFASVAGNIDGLKTKVDGVVGRFGALGAVLSTAIGALQLRGVIDTLDQLDDLSEKSGIAVERLSALRFAGEAVGTPLEDIATGARKLAQNMAAAAGGSKDAAAAFKAIGVEVKNVDGTLRSSDEVLLDIAERFSGYRDGAAKAALAQDIFGKAGERLIPLLNQGRTGIQALTQEAQQLGAIIGDKPTKAAAELGDNLTKLKLAGEAVAIQSFAPLIEKLAELSQRLLEARRNGTLLSDALSGLLSFNPTAALFGAAQKALGFEPSEVEKFKRQASDIQDAIAGVEQALQRNPNSQAAQRQLEALRQKLAEVNAEAARAQGPTSARDALRRLEGGVKVERQSRDAPVVARPQSGAAGDPDKLLRQQLAARAQALGDALSKERDALSFHERYLSQVYDAGLVSAQQFYDERANAQRQALQRQLQAFDEERAALDKARAAAKTPEARTEIDNRVNDLLRDRARLEQQAAQAGVLADGERSRALGELTAQLEEYRVQLLELRGQEGEAERARAQRQIDQFNSVSRRAGGSEQERVDYSQAVEQSLQLSEARRRLAEITDAARQAETLYLADAEKRGAGQIEVERGVYGLRQQSIAQLEQLVARVNELAVASSNPALVNYARELQTQLAAAQAQVDPATRRLFDAADQAGQAVANNFEQAIISGAKLGDVFKSIERDIIGIVTRLLVTQPLAEALANIFKGGASGGGGAGGFFTSIIGSIFGGGRASGGSVSSGRVYEVNERGPELLEMGSRAFLMMGGEGGRVQPMAARAAGGAPVINVSVQMPAGASRETALQFGRAAAGQIALAQRRNS